MGQPLWVGPQICGQGGRIRAARGGRRIAAISLRFVGGRRIAATHGSSGVVPGARGFRLLVDAARPGSPGPAPTRYTVTKAAPPLPRPEAARPRGSRDRNPRPATDRSPKPSHPTRPPTPNRFTGTPCTFGRRPGRSGPANRANGERADLRGVRFVRGPLYRRRGCGSSARHLAPGLPGCGPSPAALGERRDQIRLNWSHVTGLETEAIT